MTTDKTPTDAEIAALYADETGFALGDSPAALLDFARAVLAKWGSPVVAGEPDAYLHGDGYWTAAKTDVGRSLNDRLLFAGSPKVAVYTTPQPTQAQAGAVPMTDEQITTAGGIEDNDSAFLAGFSTGVRFAEQYHGIKGGQHGESV